jgi:myosin-1
LTTATEQHPVTVAFSSDGLRHLKELSKDQSYAKKIPIQFYVAPRKNKGIARVQITDQRRVDDIRNYWQKFGRYMCMQLGDEDWPKKDVEQPNFVKFYQRLGNVGVWGFDNGSFQVTNFYKSSWDRL